MSHVAMSPPKGISCALPTPFCNNAVDTKSLRAHVQFLCEAGIQHMVVCGTTGEAFALTAAERALILQTVRQAKPDVYITVGVSSTHASEAVLHAKQAYKEKADALLLAPPPYVKPDEVGLDTYIKAVVGATPLPVILYNNPGRVGFEIPLDCLKTWLEHPHIAGIKEASADLTRFVTLRQAYPETLLFGGDDTLFPAVCALGADGLISVGACALPSLYQQMWRAYEDNDLRIVKKVIQRLNAFHLALASFPNPAGIKALLHKKGWGDGTLRIPQTSLSEEHACTLTEAMQKVTACQS